MNTVCKKVQIQVDILTGQNELYLKQYVGGHNTK